MKEKHILVLTAIFAAVVAGIALFAIAGFKTNEITKTGAGSSVESTPKAVMSGMPYSARVCVLKNGELLGCNHNILTNDGAELVEDCLAGTGDKGCSVCDYIALSDNATHTPARTDSGLVNEMSTNGLGRTAADTVASISGTARWHVNHTFTAADPGCDGSPCDGIRLSGLFNQSSGGTMLAENSFTSVDLEGSDELTISWQLNVTGGNW